MPTHYRAKFPGRREEDPPRAGLLDRMIEGARTGTSGQLLRGVAESGYRGLSGLAQVSDLLTAGQVPYFQDVVEQLGRDREGMRSFYGEPERLRESIARITGDVIASAPQYAGGIAALGRGGTFAKAVTGAAPVDFIHGAGDPARSIAGEQESGDIVIPALSDVLAGVTGSAAFRGISLAGAPLLKNHADWALKRITRSEVLTPPGQQNIPGLISNPVQRAEGAPLQDFRRFGALGQPVTEQNLIPLKAWAMGRTEWGTTISNPKSGGGDWRYVAGFRAADPNRPVRMRAWREGNETYLTRDPLLAHDYASGDYNRAVLAVSARFKRVFEATPENLQEMAKGLKGEVAIRGRTGRRAVTAPGSEIEGLYIPGILTPDEFASPGGPTQIWTTHPAVRRWLRKRGYDAIHQIESGYEASHAETLVSLYPHNVGVHGYVHPSELVPDPSKLGNWQFPTAPSRPSIPPGTPMRKSGGEGETMNFAELVQGIMQVMGDR